MSNWPYLLGGILPALFADYAPPYQKASSPQRIAFCGISPSPVPVSDPQPPPFSWPPPGFTGFRPSFEFLPPVPVDLPGSLEFLRTGKSPTVIDVEYEEVQPLSLPERTEGVSDE